MSVSASLVASTDSGKLTEVGKIPMPVISDNELLVKAVAFAANPTDWKHIAYGIGSKGDIAGSDVSGVVVQVGKNVTGFSVGDTVSVFVRGGYSTESGAFAEYVKAPPISTIKYESLDNTPLSIGEHESGKVSSFEGAASITLGLLTVTLSYAHSLHITPGDGKSILIWGGATATGVLAIQVAKLVFGLKVITTASAKHHEWLKSLGADAVFDYHDRNAVDQIRTYANGSIAYALDTVALPETFQAVYDATQDSKHVALDNLLGVDASNITETPGRSVSYGSTLLYLIFGKDVSMGKKYTATPELISEYKALLPKVLEIVPKLRHSKLKVLEPGFGTASEALELLKEDKVSGEKLVWRAA